MPLLTGNKNGRFPTDLSQKNETMLRAAQAQLPPERLRFQRRATLLDRDPADAPFAQVVAQPLQLEGENGLDGETAREGRLLPGAGREIRYFRVDLPGAQ